MDEAGNTLFVNKHLGGHTAEFEKLYFLAVLLEDAVVGIGQACKRQIVLSEISGELLGVFRTDYQNHRVSLNKSINILAQLRHMRAAEWSLESAVEHQQHILLFFEVRKADQIAVKILQCKIRGR